LSADRVGRLHIPSLKDSLPVLLQAWLFDVAAVFVSTVTPGPSVLMCVTHGVNHGARRTFFATGGSVASGATFVAASALPATVERSGSHA